MLFALTLTTLAGLSTGLGGLVVLLFKRPRARMMAFSMGFAGGVMLTVSLSDMLPHTVETYSDTMGRFPAALASASLCVMGMLIALLLERCIPDEKELAARPDGHAARGTPAINPGALRSAMVTTAAIVLHNLPEGILTLFTSYASPTLGATLTLAIALHNIPEGIAISVPVYYATNSRVRGALYALLSGRARRCAAGVLFAAELHLAAVPQRAYRDHRGHYDLCIHQRAHTRGLFLRQARLYRGGAGGGHPGHERGHLPCLIARRVLYYL